MEDKIPIKTLFKEGRTFLKVYRLNLNDIKKFVIADLPRPSLYKPLPRLAKESVK